MSDLLNKAIDAHGGRKRWQEINAITVKASIGGAMWDLKGKGGMLSDVQIDIDPREQRVRYSPFGSAGRRFTL